MLEEKKHNLWITNELIRYSILAYWSIFWLLNSLDKIIGGSHYLWVGKDRFAQFQKFFASAGIESPLIANLALIVAAALEIFALIFFSGALIYYFKKKKEQAHGWFFVGIILTLVTFTFFSIGDHVFGDRFELLEHTLFWFIALFSWLAFSRISEHPNFNAGQVNKQQLIYVSIFVFVLGLATSTSIFKHNSEAFVERSAPITSKEVDENLYKVSFPFLGGSTVFEASLEKFKKDYPDKRIDHIYTVPDPLRLKKADALIFYIITEEKK